MTNLENKIPGFWDWFWGKPPVSRAGWKKIVIDCWFCFHVGMGVIAAIFLYSSPIKMIAGDLIFPVSAIFVGLCFSWGGTVFVLLQHEKLQSFLNDHPDKHINYLYTFQMGTLIFLITVIYWGAMKLVSAQVNCCVIDEFCFIDGFLKFIGFTLFSLAVRECWVLPLGISYMMAIMQKDNTKK